MLANISFKKNCQSHILKIVAKDYGNAEKNMKTYNEAINII